MGIKLSRRSTPIGTSRARRSKIPTAIEWCCRTRAGRRERVESKGDVRRGSLPRLLKKSTPETRAMENQGLFSRKLVRYGIYRQWQPEGCTGGQPLIVAVRMSRPLTGEVNL